YLSESLLWQALNITQKRQNEQSQAKVLVAIAIHSNDALLMKKIMNILEEFGNVEVRIEALIELVDYLSEVQLREILDTVVAQDVQIRDRLLKNLLPQLAKHKLFEEALRAIPLIEDSRARIDAFKEMIYQLDNLKFFEKVLLLVQEIDKPWLRCEVFVELASRLILLGDFEKALISTQKIEYPWVRDNMLEELVPQLVGHVPLNAVVTSAQMITESRTQTKVIGSIASQLAQLGDWEQALAMLQKIENIEILVESLVGTLHYLKELPKELQFEWIFEKVLTIRERKDRTRMLEQLVPQFTQLSSSSLLLLWQMVLENLVYYTREELLNELYYLIPVIAELGGGKAVIEFFYATQNVKRWWP
ncbi:MAG: hypothetical protein GY801_02380, partial [bacterium]|nr:hypothetical protein [bacterium]